MPSYRDTRAALPAGTLTLPASHYTDAEVFRRELDAIFAGMWLHVGRGEDLPDAGSYITRSIAGANILLLRDEHGAVAGFHNACRHRGTILCRQEAGTLRGKLQCPYHAWTYGLDGRLIAAPHMDRVEGFRAADYPLAGVKTATWDGHIFLHLGASPPALSEQLGNLEEKFLPWSMRELRRVERRVYDVKANWKLIVQNYSECLHCPIAHPLFSQHSHYMSGENDPPHPGYLGGSMHLREGAQTLSMDGSSNRACLPGLPVEATRCVYYYAILPSFLLSLHPDYMLTTVLWPQAVDRTLVISEWHFHPAEIARPGFDPTGAVAFWDLTNRQDWELSERAQEGIASRGYRPGPYSHREELLHAFDRWVLERVKS